MEEESKNNPLKNLFNSAKSVLVILPPDPSSDLLSSGLSFYLSLKSSGKDSQIGCAKFDDPQNLSGISDIKETVGNQNLHITFNFSEENLEKVDYDITPDGKFSLLIKPKTGHTVPDINDIKFSYSGANSDLVVVFGINSLEELGKIYADEKRFLDTATILSINTSGQEAVFTPNMFHLANVSFAELTCLLLQRIELNPTAEASTNLLATIYQNTSSLTSPKMTADTFGSLSFLMRHGGRLPFSPETSLFGAPISPPSFFDNPAPPDWKAPKIFRHHQPGPTPTDKQ